MSTVSAAQADSTLEGMSAGDRPDRGLRIRRCVIAVLVVLQIAAATGWLGVRTATVTAANGGYSLSVTYPQVARAGLDVPFDIRVAAPEPITTEIVIGITAEYFRMFETQGFFPDPADVASDATTVWMTFAPPPAGRELVVNYDAYIQPSSQRGKSAKIRLVVGSAERASVDISTALLP